MDVTAISQIPCPLCNAMIRSQKSFVKQYMELCEHCKNKFALKFCVCDKTGSVDRRQEKYATSDHKERYGLRDRRGVDKNWLELSPERKLQEKDEIFYKNMHDFFKHFPPCPRKVPKYKIKPLLDDRLYGNIEDFFRNIGPSPSYDSVHSARYDGPEKDEHRRVIETRERVHKHYGDGSADGHHQVLETAERHYEHFRGDPVASDGLRLSEKHERRRKYYSGPLVVDDHRSISEKPSDYTGWISGPVRERPHRLIETHESSYKRYFGVPVMDDHGRDSERYERHESIYGGSSADHRPGTAKGFAMKDKLHRWPDMENQRPSERYECPDIAGIGFELFTGGPLGSQTAPDLREKSRRRKGDKTQRGYESEPDTMVHERGEKPEDEEKLKKYMELAKEQAKREKEHVRDPWAVANNKKGLKTKIKKKTKAVGDGGSQKSEEGGEMGKSEQKQVTPESDKKNETRDSKTTDISQSNEGIVPLTEKALHLEDLDKRTSENQARKIEQRLKDLARKQKKPIIRELIELKKKTPRVVGTSRVVTHANFAHLNSTRGLSGRTNKENIEPKKISEIDLLNVSSSQDLESIIIGPKLYQYRPPLKESVNPNINEPLLYKVMPVVESKLEFVPPPEPVPRKGTKSKTREEPAPPALQARIKSPPEWEDHSGPVVQQIGTDGIISYALSDRHFIDKGWSKLPTEHIVRRVDLYRMRPARPDLDWFERNKVNEKMRYESGETFALFNNEEGRCKIYYKNGSIALEHYQSEEPLSQKRIVIYSKADPCSHKNGKSILAIFDQIGNGVVFDHKGKIRLKFNQTEGIVFDKSLGPLCRWEWHSLNDPPQLKNIMVDTNLTYKDEEIFKIEDPHNVPKREVDEEVHAIEMDNMLQEKKKKMALRYKRFPIRIKSVKINDQFTLLIIDQASIYIKFKEGSTFFKTHIGMVLDQNEIIDTVTEKLGSVMNSVERRPAPTDSLAELQRTVLKAQRDDKRAKMRDLRLNRPADYNAELDKKMTFLSKPSRKFPTPLKPFICNCDLLCTCPE